MPAGQRPQVVPFSVWLGAVIWSINRQLNGEIPLTNTYITRTLEPGAEHSRGM
jgi:hypothetical protein